MLILKQSTAIDIRMGPFVDATDGVTPETGITLGAADQAEVLKANGAATVAMGGTFAAVTGSDGWYDYTVATGDVDTVGEVVFVVQDSSVCLPVFTRAYVVEEAVYDAMYGASAAGPALASSYTATRAGYLDNVNNSALSTTASQSGDSYARLGAPAGASVSADIADVPTVSEFNARTLLAADYFDPATDTVANVTTTANVTNQVSADVTAISGDATAADNLEAMYDGTGYIDSTAPASRSQVDAIGAASGGAINYAPTGDNTGGALKGVTFVGTQSSGTFADADAEDGVYHQITHTTNAIDIVYSYFVGADNTATEIDWFGYLTSANDVITVQAYDFPGATWDTRAVITGTNGTTNQAETIKLLGKHTGTSGADIGTCYIRFVTSAQTSPVLNSDAVFVAAVNTSTSLGFLEASVWIDTVNGESGTGEGVGTASTPVNNITDAKTIADNNNIKRFRVISGSNFSLDTGYDGYEFVNAGTGAIINLNGQSVSNTLFNRIRIQGSDDGSNVPRTFYDNCRFDGNTLGDFFGTDCAFAGTIVLAQASNTYTIDVPRPVSATTIPTVDLNLLTSVEFIATRVSCDMEFQQLVATSSVEIHGEGGNITINANCTGGTVTIYGSFTLTDNSGGAVTVVDAGRIMSETHANKTADHILRRALADARASSDGDPVVFRSILGAVSKLCNRVAASSTTLTVYEEDDLTSFATQTLTTDPNAEPITEVDTN